MFYRQIILFQMLLLSEKNVLQADDIILNVITLGDVLLTALLQMLFSKSCVLQTDDIISIVINFKIYIFHKQYYFKCYYF